LHKINEEEELENNMNLNNNKDSNHFSRRVSWMTGGGTTNNFSLKNELNTLSTNTNPPIPKYGQKTPITEKPDKSSNWLAASNTNNSGTNNALSNNNFAVLD